MEAGKPQKQSLAIAYQMKKKAQKMAHGGESCQDCANGTCMLHKSEGGYVREEEASGYSPMPMARAKLNESARMEDDRDLNQHGEEEQGPYGEKRMAHGGFIGSYQDDEDEMDMVGRIMKQRQEHYSEGGRVANEDHGPRDSRLADFDQNEFDELAMKDDLKSDYTGANSGDEIGDDQEDEDRHDIVSRIMKSRKIMDRMPIPGYGTSCGRNK